MKSKTVKRNDYCSKVRTEKIEIEHDIWKKTLFVNSEANVGNWKEKGKMPLAPISENQKKLQGNYVPIFCSIDMFNTYIHKDIRIFWKKRWKNIIFCFKNTWAIRLHF